MTRVELDLKHPPRLGDVPGADESEDLLRQAADTILSEHLKRGRRRSEVKVVHVRAGARTT